MCSVLRPCAVLLYIAAAHTDHYLSCCGSASALSTIPIDVMVAQIQQVSAIELAVTEPASKAGQAVSVVDTFKAQYAEGGMQQIVGFATRGFGARVAHVALTTALMKTVRPTSDIIFTTAEQSQLQVHTALCIV
eukprot:15599-Heterococcus_DN1.PRE.1